MPDELLNPTDVEEVIDDPEARGSGELGMLAPDKGQFGRLLDDAVAHAATAAEADPGARPWAPAGARNIGGRIRTLAQHPTDANVLWAGSGFGGVWHTTDGGDTWAPLDSFPPVGSRLAPPVGALAVARRLNPPAPSDPRVLYVGTGEPVILRRPGQGYVPEWHFPGSGLYRSDDGGGTFTQVAPPDGPPIDARRFERIRVDPWDPDRYWVASTSGLHRHVPGTANNAFTRDIIDSGVAPTDPPNFDASDVLVDFGDPRDDTPPADGRLSVYVAIRGSGIFRRVYDRTTDAYEGAGWEHLTDGLPDDVYRVKLAHSWSRPRQLYAVFGLPPTGDTVSRVYRSTDGGDSWEETGARPDDDSNRQAWYDLVLEVHPDHPEIVVMGAVDLFRSLNAGDGWEKVLSWRRYNAGDRAQHADQHAVVFDLVDDGAFWVGNDGGISLTRNLGSTWRKRSHGILATQFYFVAANPTHPWIRGGGLQDNGSWISFGGGTWYYLFGGDGGAVAPVPGNPRRAFTGSQGVSLRADVGGVAGAPDYVYRSPAPDLAAGSVRTEDRRLTGFADDHGPIFTHLVVQHPSTADHALIGRKRAGYVTTDGSSVTVLATGAFSPAGAEVSALAYAPTAADTDWWLGTDRGEVFVTTDGNNTPSEAWTNVTPGPMTDGVSAIAVHPANPVIVAVAEASRPGRIWLTGDKGVNWWEISGRTPPLSSPAATPPATSLAFSPSPASAVAFHPQSPAAVGSDQILFVGTLAGVMVIRNARAATAPAPPGATPDPEWRTFNSQLPLTLVNDLSTAEERDAASNVARRVLLAATHGRGIYECDLAGGPPTRLYIRDSVVDVGREFDPAATMADDPRLPPGTALPADRSHDIKVDARPFIHAGGRIDGVEMDQELSSQDAVAGEEHRVHVQVHNGGVQSAVNVEVRLFQAAAAGGVPDLQNTFWTGWPNPGAGDWTEVGSVRTIPSLGPGNPVVVAFPWTPPVSAGDQVALLALVTHASDALPAGSLPRVVADLVGDERRASLRVVDVSPFVPDVYIRDGVDDRGEIGAVGWGGRSPDIIVVRNVLADPRTALADLGDRRLADFVQGGELNRVYVRVNNRTQQDLSADVTVWAAPLETLHDFGTWTPLGPAQRVSPVPARDWGVAGAIPWSPDDPDPTSDAPEKPIVLVAAATLADDEAPDLSGMTDTAELWRRIMRQGRANNAAFRVLTWRRPA